MGRGLPNLDDYDNAPTRQPDFGLPVHLPYDLVYGGDDETGASDDMLSRFIGGDDWANDGLIKFLYADRTHAMNAKQLKDLGVDGSVPLEVARLQIKRRAPIADNDNVFEAKVQAA